MACAKYFAASVRPSFCAARPRNTYGEDPAIGRSGCRASACSGADRLLVALRLKQRNTQPGMGGGELGVDFECGAVARDRFPVTAVSSERLCDVVQRRRVGGAQLPRQRMLGQFVGLLRLAAPSSKAASHAVRCANPRPGVPGAGAGGRFVAYWARRGISSGGRAIGSQSIGQGFESPILHMTSGFDRVSRSAPLAAGRNSRRRTSAPRRWPSWPG